MKEVYGCGPFSPYGRGLVLSTNEDGRDCPEKSCAYRMSHGKCGYLHNVDDDVKTSEEL